MLGDAILPKVHVAGKANATPASVTLSAYLGTESVVSLNSRLMSALPATTTCKKAYLFATMASAGDLQALLRFLSQDAKVPLAQAMGKVKELQAAKLNT